MKNNLRKIVIFALSICLLLAVFVSCAASGETDEAYRDYMSENKSESFDSTQGGAIPPLDGSVLPSGEAYERKIIKTARVNAETKDFEGAIACVETLCTSVNGYIESSSVSGTSYGGERGYRYANYTLRIPAERLDEFSNGLGNLLNVISSSSNANEVTASYYDIKSRIEVLEMQKESLQEMYDKYTDYGDINYLMQLQDKLFEVIAEIEAYQTQLNLYDSQVAYSTVVLNISEVVDYTDTEEKGFFARLGDAFKGGFQVFGKILNGLLIVFAYIFPELLLSGVILAVILLCVGAGKKKKAKKQAARQADQK